MNSTKDKENVNKKEKKEEQLEKKEVGIANNPDIEISEDVIASIAGIEIDNIEGVSRNATLINEISQVFGSKNEKAKGIKVNFSNGKVIVDVNVLVKYGLRIPDIAFLIQTNVKRSIQEMTQLEVMEVNVHIQGLILDNK